MEHLEDSALIARFFQGDQRAFAVLVHRYSRPVYRQIARSVHISDDVEDLVQVVFIKVYRTLDQLQNLGRFPAWLSRLVRNTVHSWHRRRAVQLRLEDALRQEPTREDVSDDVGIMVRAALQLLSPKHHQVIAHHYLKGYSYVETAELLDLSVETVRGRLKRARHRLKQELQAMSDFQPQTFALTAQDLAAFCRMRYFVSSDDNRRMMQGICLDVGGRLVVTNGHVLIVRTSERLASLAGPVILGPWQDVPLSEADGATLILGETEATFQTPPSRIVAPIIEGPYVHYETVLPQEDPLVRVTVASNLLRDAVDLLATQMEPRHPVDPTGVWQYRPRVELHLSGLTGTLTFLTSRDMGYSCSEADGKSRSFAPEDAANSPPPGGPIDWAFHVPIDIEIDESQPDVAVRMAVNFDYFKHILHALEIERGESFTLAFWGTLKPIRFCPSAHPDWQALLMPLRLETPEPA